MRCLYCYNLLNEGLHDYHTECSKKIFGLSVAPKLPYTEEQMQELATQVVRSHVALTGVQAKLSVDIERNFAVGNDAKRFTIVGLWGAYILKPPTEAYEHLPEIEDLTMHLAQLAGIATVPHSLIRLASGNLAYITKRIDRVNGRKLHMEDMCQLTERLTEDKYRGSYEQIAKAIIKYAANPGLDVFAFYEQALFSFLTGNADMHLKNFSLIKDSNGYGLAPAYDMVASALVVPDDNEDMALTLNGRKRKITRKDFDVAMLSTKMINQRNIDTLYRKFAIAAPRWSSFIDISFLPSHIKAAYKDLIADRLERLGIAV